MRFAIPFRNGRGLRLTKDADDWLMVWRLIYLVVPVALLLIFLALYINYKVSQKTLNESLEALPLLEARANAEKLETALAQTRHSLLRIAQSNISSPKALQENLQLFFHENAGLVGEISFRRTDGEGFALLRNGDSFIQLETIDASFGPYSPLQQVTTRPLHPNKVTLYPSVSFYPATVEKTQTSQYSSVLRLATPLADNSGILIVGLNIKKIHELLSLHMQSLASSLADNRISELQLSYFFDVNGWILFEINPLNINAFIPDATRRGYNGDLGRAGFDEAFRPWAVHQDYWRVVTAALAGYSGAIHSPDNISPFSPGHTGILCYAPVSFASDARTAPTPFGGIAVFETSPLPAAAFIKSANAGIVIMISSLLFLLLLTYRAGIKISSPYNTLIQTLNTMNAHNEYTSVNLVPVCKEHHQLRVAINNLIARTVTMQHDAEKTRLMMDQVNSNLPVDLNQITLPPTFHVEYDLVGSSQSIQEVREKIHKTAKAGTDILIWGETGTGKELVAFAIHKESHNANGPFISINCGALDENLLLDALFGHIKGAFSEAKADRKGAFLAANGGTLHLDEIANASIKVQQALLRALSVRRIRPLGTDQEIPFNTRVIAATNVNLRESVTTGEFREDLYYRLAVLSIETPALWRRKEDIIELAAFCIHEATTLFKRPPYKLSKGALDKLMAHNWPGNVREFKNCMTRAMAFAEHDLILSHHINIDINLIATHDPKNLSSTNNNQGITGIDIFSPNKPVANTESTQNKENDAPSSVSEHLWATPQEEVLTEAKKTQDGNIHFVYTKVPPASSQNIPPLTPASTRADYPVGDESFTSGEDMATKKLAAPESQQASRFSSNKFEALNERQRAGFSFAQKHGSLTRLQYEEITTTLLGVPVSSRTAQNDLKGLVTAGLLNKIGAGPGTKYIFAH